MMFSRALVRVIKIAPITHRRVKHSQVDDIPRPLGIYFKLGFLVTYFASDDSAIMNIIDMVRRLTAKRTQVSWADQCPRSRRRCETSVRCQRCLPMISGVLVTLTYAAPLSRN